jgi:hypothetical protein
MATRQLVVVIAVPRLAIHPFLPFGRPGTLTFNQ